MNALTLGYALESLRNDHGMTKTELGQSIGHKDESLIRRYERDQSVPTPQTLDRIALALNLNFHERHFLYALRELQVAKKTHTGRKSAPKPVPNEEEIALYISKVTPIYDAVAIPVIAINYKHEIIFANQQAATLVDLRSEDVRELLHSRITLFEVVLDKEYLRDRVENLRDTAIDLIRDFQAYNVLRRLEPFYQQYPMCLDYLPEFSQLWNHAEKSDPYFALMQRRSMYVGDQIITLSGVQAGKRLSFYISRHNVPLLDNQVRVFRLLPVDQDTKESFPSPRNISQS